MTNEEESDINAAVGIAVELIRFRATNSSSYRYSDTVEMVGKDAVAILKQIKEEVLGDS